MKTFLKALAVLVSLVPVASIAGDYKKVTAEELVDLKKSGELVIIDSRSEKYMDGKIIEGAKVIATGDLTEESLAAVAPKKDAKIVFYCSNVNCPASAKSAAKAISFGYSNIHKYAGGIDEWVEKGLPVQEI